MKLVYVIGPLSADTIFEQIMNIRKAEAFAIKLWRAGFAVICPHLNTGLLCGATPEEDFLKGDIEILSRCDFAVTIEGWQQSTGSLGEIEYCYKNGIRRYPADMSIILREEAKRAQTM